MATNLSTRLREAALARRVRLAPFAAAVLLAAGPGLAQKTDSALVAELKRYLRRL